MQAKALLSKKTQRCYCCKHLDEELQDLYPPVSLQGNDGNGKRQRPVPNEYFGGGKIARLSFKVAISICMIALLIEGCSSMANACCLVRKD